MSTRLVQFLVLLGCAAAIVLATSNSGRSGYPRPNRGFKNAQLSTARGFGKRDGRLLVGGSQPLIPALSPSSLDGILPLNFDSRTSYPTSWLIDEIQNNPEVARMIVERYVDENGDGELSPDELFRRSYY